MLREIYRSFKCFPSGHQEGKGVLFYYAEELLAVLSFCIFIALFFMLVVLTGTFLKVMSAHDLLGQLVFEELLFWQLKYCACAVVAEALSVCGFHRLMMRKPTDEMYGWLESYVKQEGIQLDTMPDTKREFAFFVDQAYKKQAEMIKDVKQFGAFARL